MATTLLSGATTVSSGVAVDSVSNTKTYQASGATTAGTGSVTVQVQGSNDAGEVKAWDTIGTITLTLGTEAASDSFTSEDRYDWVRGNVTAISGTGASVSLTMGY